MEALGTQQKGDKNKMEQQAVAIRKILILLLYFIFTLKTNAAAIPEKECPERLMEALEKHSSDFFHGLISLADTLKEVLPITEAFVTEQTEYTDGKDGVEIVAIVKTMQALAIDQIVLEEGVSLPFEALAPFYTVGEYRKTLLRALSGDGSEACCCSCLCPHFSKNKSLKGKTDQLATAIDKLILALK